jgi:hypothetical protein
MSRPAKICRAYKIEFSSQNSEVGIQEAERSSESGVRRIEVGSQHEKNSGNVSGSDCLVETSKLLEADVSSILNSDY